MHDESLNKEEQSLQGKYILETTAALKKFFNIPEPKAVELLGRVMKLRNDFANAKEIITYIEFAAKKPVEKMTEDERLMLLASGHLHRVRPPFQSQLTNIGRNEPCPCHSGKKFKACCLNVARAAELTRFKDGK